jgi:Calcium binding
MRAKARGRSSAPRISEARLVEMIEEATVDAYGESEQAAGWCAVIDGHLATPFETTVLGVPVIVERIDLDECEQIVAICKRGREQQLIPILNLPLPAPRPEGAVWIEAYRLWRRGG